MTFRKLLNLNGSPETLMRAWGLRRDVVQKINVILFVKISNINDEKKSSIKSFKSKDETIRLKKFNKIRFIIKFDF